VFTVSQVPGSGLIGNGPFTMCAMPLGRENALHIEVTRLGTPSQEQSEMGVRHATRERAAIGHLFLRCGAVAFRWHRSTPNLESKRSRRSITFVRYKDQDGNKTRATAMNHATQRRGRSNGPNLGWNSKRAPRKSWPMRRARRSSPNGGSVTRRRGCKRHPRGNTDVAIGARASLLKHRKFRNSL